MKARIALGLAVTATMAVLATVTAALADDVYAQCLSSADGSNQAWLRCGDEYVEREKAQLDRTWAAFIDAQLGQTRSDLLAEQAAWADFFRLACAFYANGDLGREGQVLSYPACKARLYHQRKLAIEAYREGPR